jgi:carboxypeptidase PM20D1
VVKNLLVVIGFFLSLDTFSQHNSEIFVKEESISSEELLQKLIQFESISTKENPLAEFVMTFSKNYGLYVQNFSKNLNATNFTASLYPLSANKPNIILTSHLDVVPSNDIKNWKYPPFSGKIVNDTIWGRGAIDCKGLAVMQLAAIINFVALSKTQNLNYNVTFLGISGEENNNPDGANYIISEHLKELNPIVVFGEGGSGLTNLVPSKPELEVFGISVAEKSSLWLRLDAKNKANGHGAVPPDLYANKRLIKALIDLLDQKRKIKFLKVSREMFKELGKLEGGFKGFIIKHINWTVFWPFVKKYFREGEIFNVLVNNTFLISEMGTINSGSVNQIGSGAYAVLDCRLLPGTDKKKFIRKVQFAVGLKVNITIISESPNTLPSKKDQFYENMQQALQNVYPKCMVSPILFPASTDNNYFRQYQIPTFGIIPVIFSRNALEGVHGDNEYLPIKDLYLGIEVYKKFISLTLK